MMSAPAAMYSSWARRTRSGWSRTSASRQAYWGTPRAKQERAHRAVGEQDVVFERGEEGALHRVIIAMGLRATYEGEP